MVTTNLISVYISFTLGAVNTVPATAVILYLFYFRRGAFKEETTKP